MIGVRGKYEVVSQHLLDEQDQRDIRRVKKQA